VINSVLETLVASVQAKRAAINEQFLFQHREHVPAPVMELFTEDALRTRIHCGCGDSFETTVTISILPEVIKFSVYSNGKAA
jgi:hypothetical protein